MASDDDTPAAESTEMDSNHGAFPSFTFPHDPKPTDDTLVQRHHLFQEYGLYEAVDLRDGADGLATLARKCHGTDQDQHKAFYAPEPTLPLLPPNQACSIHDVDQADVVKQLYLMRPGQGRQHVSCTRVQDQIKYLYQRHADIMFHTSSHLLWEYFIDMPGKKYSRVVNTLHSRGDVIPVRMSYVQKCASDFSSLLDDVLCDIPRELLENYINEDLTVWRDRLIADSAETGGSMCYQELCSTSHDCKGAIMYPSSAYLDVLNVGTLSVKHRANDSVISQNTEVVVDPYTQQFSLNGRILQCESVKVQNQDMFAVRSNYHCTTLSFDSTDGDQGQAKVLQTVHFDKSPTSVALSPYIAGEVVISTETGAAYLLWADGRLQQVVPDQDSTLNFVSDNPQRACHFGSHPRLLVYSDSTGVELKDVRSGPQNDRRPLFSLPSRWTMKGERVMFSRTCPTNSFQHVIAMKRSLVIVDERFPQNPLVKWSHMMKSPPVFMDIVSCTAHNLNSHVILLANQRPQETTCFQYVNEGSCPPVSVRQPFSVSKVSSWLPCLTSSRQTFSNGFLERRLQKPLIGACFMRHNSKDSGFSALQMTSMGDMFYQSFIPDNRTGITAGRPTEAGPVSLSPLSTERCSSWVDRVISQSQDPDVCYPSLTRVQYKDVAKAKPLERSSYRLVQMRNAKPLAKAFTAGTSIHPSCTLCKPNSAFVDVDSQDDSCPSCHHDIKFSTGLSGVHKTNSVLTCQSLGDTEGTQHLQASYELNLIDPTESSDHLSMVLLKTWDGDYDQYFAEKSDKGGEVSGTAEQVRPVKRKRHPSGDQVITSTPARPDAAPLPFLSPISLPTPGGVSPSKFHTNDTDMSFSITPKPRASTGKAKKRKSIMGF
ncbi:PREDICTED: TATA box-binding protein-associated factor RNA polymerase I subunit C-like [Branchiostoma belcheri]|uniref:TATA box-binding protein-associated factor RNA polymerase I subunit C-like n=1 Tax=Branchiostoma belcheri TaxID=7741 RepID=A0A6P4ZP83_BRABE|nr:PREDICTED: TATA box-binding protein-associated factor RNA polymerase I subunit C-like [Branchiostoma belcheri]XP_019638643.1 PREDICTED: TATA box-binding protein-associated factor RNA polymerase I subunit C-like [Branchiostoma belcheri]XP_019638644.1 PREDICTED: TATA box-binding protein-associated factor RNA polymerase I subunit C-like [Branchiostoma belcheri]